MFKFKILESCPNAEEPPLPSEPPVAREPKSVLLAKVLLVLCVLLSSLIAVIRTSIDSSERQSPSL